MSAREQAVLRQIVARDRAQFQAAVARAKAVVRHQLDPGRRASQSPWVWLGAGFCLGLWLGAKRREGSS